MLRKKGERVTRKMNKDEQGGAGQKISSFK